MRIQSWDSTYRYAGTLAPETYQLFRQPHQKRTYVYIQCRPKFCPGTYFCHTIFAHKFSYEKNIYLLLIMQKHKICVILL